LFFGLTRILVHEMYIRRAYLARIKQSIFASLFATSRF
jgi:hypothetical protein